MSNGQRARQARTFRFLLFLGAAVSIALGMWGVFWVEMLERSLGVDASGAQQAFRGLAGLFGAGYLALGVGYALAAAQPSRSRSLLVVLFVAPLGMAISVIASVARHDLPGWRGGAFAAYNLAYCLLYFRTYPRLDEERPPDVGPDPQSFEPHT